MRDFELSPKSVVRDMFERALSFGELISFYQLARSEGLVLRYLSDAYRAIRQTVPAEAQTPRAARPHRVARRARAPGRLEPGRRVGGAHQPGRVDPDGAGRAARPAVGAHQPPRVPRARAQRAVPPRAAWPRCSATTSSPTLDPDVDWSAALDAYFDEHDEILTGGAARSPRLVTVDETDVAASGVWQVEQTIDDPAGDHDWRIRGEVDLAASEEEGTAVVRITEVLRL